MTFLQLNNLPHRALREEVIATTRKMNALGINHGKAGNVSVRVDGGFLITPTGVAYESLQPDHIVALNLDGCIDTTHAANADLAPSSEWRFHRDIYAARSDVSAIVHTHSPYATTLASHARGIPAFHYMVAVAGGADIRCAAYATFGTQALSDAIVDALADRKACLMAQHGMVACDVSLAKSLALAVEVENLARVYWQALQIGEPHLLSDAEMAVVIEKFKTYGQPAPAPPSV
jgi:L-fuculose-phosphate aldolase